ncbi:MAG: TetR family transcriptional regulator [Pseudomonadota bacterium]
MEFYNLTESLKRHIDVREKIIDTAIELFAAKGFRGTSIRDIASSAGLHMSNIYHYFGSKEGLMQALLQKSSRLMAHEMRQVSQKEMDPIKRFKLLLKTHVYQTVKQMKKAKVININEEHLSPEGTEMARQVQLEVLDLYRKELKNLERLGYVRFKSLTVAAFNMLGAVNWIIRWYRPDGPLSLEEISEEIVSFVLHGILDSQAPD